MGKLVSIIIILFSLFSFKSADTVSDARKNAKKRSAELVYTGVQYAYTTAMYNGEGLEEVHLDDIESNLSIDNMKSKTIKVKNGIKTLEVVTLNDVVCDVTENNGVFTVDCGENMSARKIGN